MALVDEISTNIKAAVTFVILFLCVIPVVLGFSAIHFLWADDDDDADADDETELAFMKPLSLAQMNHSFFFCVFVCMISLHDFTCFSVKRLLLTRQSQCTVCGMT